MHTLLTSLAGIIAAPFLFVSGLFGGHTPPPAPQPAPIVETNAYDIYHIHATEVALTATAKAQGILGATNPLETPVAVFHTSLANAINSTATNMTLVSALTADGTTLASSTYSFVIDSGQPTQEFVIADCTGTVCTNMQRGLSVVNGTTTVASNQQPHRRTASVDIVDAPLLLKVASYFNGIAGLPNAIYYQIEPNWLTATGTTLVTLNQLNKTAFGAVPVNTNSGGTGLTNLTLPINTMLVYPGTGGVLVGTSSPTFPYVTVGYVNATSTTATSTFAGGVAIGQSQTVGGNVIVTGNITAGGSITAGSILVPPLGLLGNAADGNLTYAGTTNLTQDVFAGNVTVSGTVFTNGWRIFATGTVAVSNGGKISVDGRPGALGGSGSTCTSPGAGGAAATSTGMLGFGSAGLAGTNSNTGTTNSALKVVDTLGGAGGAGGASGASGQISPGGTASSTLARFLNITDAMSVSAYSTTTGAYVRANGGTGGGGGGGGNGDSGCGGGGGGGAGVLAIFAQNVSIASGGSITANGGAGGGGGTSNGAGGGGGGGGGIVIGYTGSYTNSGSVTAIGGAIGTSQGGGGTPVAGAVGKVIILKMQ